MNQKKSTKILLIIVIVLIILLIAGVALVYFSTDILKSNKELFFKYASQITEENTIIETSLKEYMEKKKTTPYTNQGTFKVNVTAENGQEQFENVNNFNVTFSGQVDTANSKATQDISINYSDSVNFPLTYKKIDDTIGFQTKYIGNKFVAASTSNLGNLLTDSTNSIDEITESLESVQEIKNISQEDTNNIQNKYIEIIEEQLSKDKFSKVSNENSNGYKLTLTGEEIKNILVQLLENLKNDQTTLDKLNEYLKTQANASTITTNDIEDAIEELNEATDLQDEKLEITVYEKQRKITAIEIATNQVKINLQKTSNDNELKYNISLEINDSDNNETYQISLNMGYTGINTMQQVGETYSLDYKTSEIEYQYTFENNVDLTKSNTIEEFTSENSMILDNYEQEQVESFMQAVTERLTEVNKRQMEELGLDSDENPIQYIIPSFNISSSGSLSSLNQTDINETEISTFNQKFELYESTNLQGVTVKGLLSTISLSNESQDEDMQIKEINFNGEEYEASETNITFIKSDIDTEKSYRVEFEKDQDTGIIYRAVINEK